jgi:hypothetical protein
MNSRSTYTGPVTSLRGRSLHVLGLVDVMSQPAVVGGGTVGWRFVGVRAERRPPTPRGDDSGSARGPLGSGTGGEVVEVLSQAGRRTVSSARMCESCEGKGEGVAKSGPIALRMG